MGIWRQNLGNIGGTDLMITATCNNDGCTANLVPFFILGEPSRVECGACHNDCDLTDPQDDPPIEALEAN